MEGTDGVPIACLTSFSLHYVGTGHADHVSADYFGAYARWMQRLFGPELVPLLFNGASGDVNNVDVHDPQQPSGRPQAERVAGILAGETLRVVQRATARFPEDVALGAATAPLLSRKAVTADLDASRSLPPRCWPGGCLRGAAGGSSAAGGSPRVERD